MLSWNDVMKLLGQDDEPGNRVDFAVLRQILAYMGNPQEQLKFIHVAGTNGKGSASRMMQAILTASGYHTGLFISPHLEYMNERWSIDGHEISDQDIAAAARETRNAVNHWNAANPDQHVRPAAFVLLTLMAFYWFAREHCGIVVLEVGIGGRLDSTNVIDAPECALIMNIGLEHTELLGNTIEEIAWQKGGIIKEGCDVVLYHQTPEAEHVIEDICRDKHAHLHITNPADITSSACRSLQSYARNTMPNSHFSENRPSGFQNPSRANQISVSAEIHNYFSYRRHKDIDLALAGSYQRKNALVVLDAVDILRAKGWNIPESAIHTALSSVTWPGRFEVISSHPPVIVDGAHNPNGIHALVDAIQEQQYDDSANDRASGILAKKSIIFVIGIMADKDIDSMLEQLAPLASAFIMEAPANSRADSPEDLQARASRYYHGPIHTAPTIEKALELAVSAADSDRDAIICCGSLFQVAAIRHYFGL